MEFGGSQQQLFTEEFDEGFVFQDSVDGAQNCHTSDEFDSQDSIVTNGSAWSKLSRKAHFEAMLQKANSISGIRKMNISFK